MKQLVKIFSLTSFVPSEWQFIKSIRFGLEHVQTEYSTDNISFGHTLIHADMEIQRCGRET